LRQRGRKADEKIFTTRAAWCWAGLIAQRQRKLLREEFLPAQIRDVTGNEVREIALKHARNLFATAQSEVAPQMIGTQARVSDDRCEALGVVVPNGAADMAQQQRAQRHYKISVGFAIQGNYRQAA
jgi:hypothetical protein